MTVEELLRAAEELPPDEQLRLLTELSQRITARGKPRRSITELRGSGREVWDDVDAQEYVNRKRDSRGGWTLSTGSSSASTQRR
jgi:hypothetical protein